MREKPILLGLLIFVIYLIPVLHIFRDIPNAKIYDRYLAIPLIGIFILIEAMEIFKEAKDSELAII